MKKRAPYLEGKGAHLGSTKAVNTGEVSNGAAIPDRLTLYG